MDNLSELSAYFPKKLYAVGGAVRDRIAGYKPHDVDIAADVSPEDVELLLKTSDFSVKTTSKKLMTLKITGKGSEYEYTAFRADSYGEGHSPLAVSRTSDITTDALRRDFTMNAVYCDAENNYIDPLGGIDDIKRKTVRMTREETFSEDGLRLMRLCRQAAELGFSIEEETKRAAKENSFRIREISPERIREELDRILCADLRYGVSGAHKRGLLLLDEIGVLEEILPEITLGKGMEQPKAYHKYDVFNHIIETVGYADREVRLAALLHDAAKPYCKINFGNYKKHPEEGARLAEEILKKYRYSNATVKEVCFLVENHMFDLKIDKTDLEVMRFLQKNRRYAEKLFALKEADFKGSGVLEGECKTVKRHRKILAEMIDRKLPFSVADLAIDGYDLERLGIKGERIGKLLDALVEECLSRDLSTKEKQLEFIKEKEKGYAD